MSRKIVQIATAQRGQHGLVSVAALAEDGSLWLLEPGNSASSPPAWRRLPDLPENSSVSEGPDKNAPFVF